MAKLKQKVSRKSLNSSKRPPAPETHLDHVHIPPPTPFNYPAVSIIIPLYNAEKYIGECLDSILAQTFQNFEVIVVDDCSTDSSPAVVNACAPKFNGRLTLTKTQKNSGGPGEPSNIGIAFSRGEYLLILDNDDTITPTALSELYSLAKKFDADVVACEKYYDVPEKFWYDAEFRKKLQPYSYQQGEFVSEPTLLSDNLFERIKTCFERKFLWNIWSKLIRRNLLMGSKIRFVQNIIQDMLFTCCLIYAAKRFVRVPNVVNIYRQLSDSLSHRKDSFDKYFLKYTHALTTGIRYFDEFLSGREFFVQHPDAKYLALEIYYREIIDYLLKIYAQVPAHQLDTILREEFSVGDNVALAAFAFNRANIHQLQHMQTIQRFNQFAAQAQEQVNRFNQFAAQAQARIAELENEVKQLKSKE